MASFISSVKIAGAAFFYVILLNVQVRAELLPFDISPPSRLSLGFGRGSDDSQNLSVGLQLTFWENTQFLLSTRTTKTDVGDGLAESRYFSTGFASDPYSDLSGDLQYQSDYDLARNYWFRGLKMRGIWAPSQRWGSWFSLQLGIDPSQLTVPNTPNFIFSSDTINFNWTSFDFQILLFLDRHWTATFGYQKTEYPRELAYLAARLAPLVIPFESISYALSLPDEIKRAGLVWNMPWIKRHRPSLGFNLERSHSFADGSATGTSSLDLSFRFNPKWYFRISGSGSKLLSSTDIQADTGTINRAGEIEAAYQW